MPESNIIIYQTEDGRIRIETRLEDETVWLTIDQMAELFQRSRSTINEHILNIYAEQELEEQASMRKIGNSDFSTKPTHFYNMDVIISVGYRVKSHQGTRFRQWATARLREYLITGFTMNDELLKQAEGGNYFDERLDDFLRMTGNDILNHAGTIRHQQALEKAHAEYDRYRSLTAGDLSEAEKHFVAHIEKEAKKLSEPEDIKKK